MKRLCVIGAGPGGYVAAIYAAKRGLDVTLFEKEYLGGECSNHGCIPTKTFYSYAHLVRKNKAASRRKIFDSIPAIDYRMIVNRKDQVVKRLRSGIAFLLKQAGVEYINKEALFIGDKRVEIVPGGEVMDFDHIIIATGSDPNIPPIEGLKGISPWTNRETLASNSLPENIAIIGAGVIGVEFASIFRSFGANVTILEIRPTILEEFDHSLREILHKKLVNDGVKIHTAFITERVERSSDGVLVYQKGGDILKFDEIIAATGRTPRLPFVGDRGIKTDRRGHIEVDEYLETSVKDVYAIGDVTGIPYLAHRASAQAEVAVDNILGHRKPAADNYPTAIFSAIEIGTVGMTEDQAKEEYGEIHTGEFPYIASGRAQAGDETDGFVKFVSTMDGVVVGVHIAGDCASELVSAATLIVKNKLTVDRLEEIVFAHPTLSEMLKESALDLFGNAVHK